MEGNAADDDLGDDFNDTADAHLLPARGKGQVRCEACMLFNMLSRCACMEPSFHRLWRQRWLRGSQPVRRQACGAVAALSRQRAPAAHSSNRSV